MARKFGKVGESTSKADIRKAVVAREAADAAAAYPTDPAAPAALVDPAAQTHQLEIQIRRDGEREAQAQMRHIITTRI